MYIKLRDCRKGFRKAGYQLCSVDGVPLVTVEVAVNLPCKLTINLADSTVALNDVQVASAAFVRADSKLSRLVGDFLFTITTLAVLLEKRIISWKTSLHRSKSTGLTARN